MVWRYIRICSVETKHRANVLGDLLELDREIHLQKCSRFQVLQLEEDMFVAPLKIRDEGRNTNMRIDIGKPCNLVKGNLFTRHSTEMTNVTQGEVEKGLEDANSPDVNEKSDRLAGVQVSVLDKEDYKRIHNSLSIKRPSSHSQNLPTSFIHLTNLPILRFNKSCQQIMHLPSTILLSAFLAAATGLASPVAQAADDVQQAAAHHGEATYYNQEGGIGSCGQRHQDSDKIVALPAHLQTGQPPKYCGRKIKIKNTSGPGKGKTVTAKVADTCPGCQGDHI
ncbi:MAG: hypothetical protein Q9214_001096, partial [Letrouitia sp. 1 TL-2023]